MKSEFTGKVIQLIKAIPAGKVCTYGGIAAMAGNPRAARQVAWVLSSMSEKERLPWHRIIGAGGRITIKNPESAARQLAALAGEGVAPGDDGRINLSRYLWTNLSD